MTLPPLNNEASASAPSYSAGTTIKDRPTTPADNSRIAFARADQVAIKGSVKTADGNLSQIRSQQDQRNALATSINRVASALEKLDLKVGSMKSQLAAIIKNYPPFPPGSDERVQLLQSYASIRKEIEEITFPPSYKALLNAKQLQHGLDGNTPLQKGTVAAGEATGIVLPATPSAYADDDAIRSAISELNGTQDVITSQRAGLVAGAAVLSQKAVPDQVRVGSRILDDLNDSKARALSLDVQQGLQAQQLGMAESISPLLKVVT
jgi:hypothetical protein